MQKIIILSKTFVIPKKGCFGDRLGKMVFDESDEGSQDLGDLMRRMKNWEGRMR